MKEWFYYTLIMLLVASVFYAFFFTDYEEKEIFATAGAAFGIIRGWKAKMDSDLKQAQIDQKELMKMELKADLAKEFEQEVQTQNNIPAAFKAVSYKANKDLEFKKSMKK